MEKRLRYGLRKSHWGLVSAVLGAFFVIQGPSVHAQEEDAPALLEEDPTALVDELSLIHI